jgi:hypothetical protein
LASAFSFFLRSSSAFLSTFGFIAGSSFTNSVSTISSFLASSGFISSF